MSLDYCTVPSGHMLSAGLVPRSTYFCGVTNSQKVIHNILRSFSCTQVPALAIDNTTYVPHMFTLSRVKLACPRRVLGVMGAYISTG